MTNKEATELLDKITSYCDFTDEYGDMMDSTPYYEAIDFAIKLLEQQPCEDCISRQAVKEQMIKYGFKAPDMTVTEFVEDCLPPVTPKSKTGHWIKQEDGTYKCSNCKKYELWEGIYCASCGARMSKREEEE